MPLTAIRRLLVARRDRETDRDDCECHAHSSPARFAILYLYYLLLLLLGTKKEQLIAIHQMGLIVSAVAA